MTLFANLLDARSGDAKSPVEERWGKEGVSNEEIADIVNTQDTAGSLMHTSHYATYPLCLPKPEW